MTNILVLPDIHGRNFWKKPIANKDKFDHIVFLGDYFDPYPSENISYEDSLNNFKDILSSFTEEELDPDVGKVELLIGNHDYAYIEEDTEVSRYSRQHAKQFREILTKLLQNNQLVLNTWITIKNTTYLFTHAGIHYEWYLENPELCDLNTPGIIKYSLKEILQNYGLSERINMVGIRRGGFYNSGGPLWCDVLDFINMQKFSPYYQIFGHSQVKFPIDNIHIEKYEKFACLDCKKAFIIDEKGIREYD